MVCRGVCRLPEESTGRCARCDWRRLARCCLDRLPSRGTLGRRLVCAQRRRPGGRCHHDPGGEVRPLPTGAAAPDGHRGAGSLRGRAWRLYAKPRSGAFFLSSGGTTLTRSGVDRTFRETAIGVGVRTATERPRAHICDIAFAGDNSIRSSRSRVNFDKRIGALHTYLGPLLPGSRCRLRRGLGHSMVRVRKL
jgi:hypothetical protein